MSPAPTLRISGPADLLQAVPYLLGFHPHDSLVVLGLADGHLVVTARVDLGDLAEADLLPGLVGALVRGGAARLVAVVYDPGPAEPLPWDGLVPELQDVCAAQDCELAELLRVSGGRWWSYLCTSRFCCPPEGNPLPDAPSPFVAEATFAGMVALPDRAALAATLDPLPAARRAALEPGLARCRDAQRGPGGQNRPDEHGLRAVERAIFAAARAADASGTDCAPGDEEICRFGAALAVGEVRDAVWLAVDHGRLDGRALWRELARRLPAPYDAVPLFLFGWRSWRAGNGALAGIAAERAVASDPGCTVADLLLSALSNGLAPDRVPKLRLPRSHRVA